MKWYPIYTAPKDGRRILIWKGGRFQSVDITCYHAGELLLPSKEQQDSVTHWMPLPESPEK